MRTFRIAFPLLLLAAALPLRGEAPPLAMKAIELLDATDEEAWSYTKTTTSRKETKVERHDATRPEGERWTLMLKDGRVPTAAERREYAQEKADALKRRKEKPETDDEQEIDLDSIRLVGETGETATFAFRVGGGSGIASAFTKDVGGTLVVRKDGGWPERFTIAATKGIRPIPGVRIDEFRVVMTYRRDAASGSILPDSIESRVRGRVFLVKSIDDDTVVRFTEFERPK